MSQTVIERLRVFLAQLPPQSQALLMREYERAIERGDDPKVANFVLDELRRVARQSNDFVRPRQAEAMRLMFRTLEPYLVDGTGTVRPGQIRRASLLPVWQWIEREGDPDGARDYLQALEATQDAAHSPEIERAIRKLQLATADVIMKVTAPGPGGDRNKSLSRIGPQHVLEDLAAIGFAFKAREAIDGFAGKIPNFFRVFGDTQLNVVNAALDHPLLVTPQVLPFVLSLVMQRLTSPWQIIRLAIKVAASDDEIRVASTPYGVAVTMAVQDLAVVAAMLRSDIKRARFESIAEHLKTVHNGVRGLRTELDIRNDSNWGKQLAAIRVEISGALQSEIEGVPGRVRRLLRQRADKDIQLTSDIDAVEVEETATLIHFVAVCRNFASELAINEVTMRTYSDLQQYVEKSTESLVETLRAVDPRVRRYRQMQTNVAIRFCAILFGQEYASLMSRAAENAMQVTERKPQRTG